MTFKKQAYLVALHGLLSNPHVMKEMEGWKIPGGQGVSEHVCQTAHHIAQLSNTMNSAHYESQEDGEGG